MRCAVDNMWHPICTHPRDWTPFVVGDLRRGPETYRIVTFDENEECFKVLARSELYDVALFTHWCAGIPPPTQVSE